SVRDIPPLAQSLWARDHTQHGACVLAVVAGATCRCPRTAGALELRVAAVGQGGREGVLVVQCGRHPGTAAACPLAVRITPSSVRTLRNLPQHFCHTRDRIDPPVGSTRCDGLWSKPWKP